MVRDSNYYLSRLSMVEKDIELYKSECKTTISEYFEYITYLRLRCEALKFQIRSLAMLDCRLLLSTAYMERLNKILRFKPQTCLPCMDTEKLLF